MSFCRVSKTDTVDSKIYLRTKRKRNRGHHTSLAYRFESEKDLNNYILEFYAGRMAYFAKNMFKKTIYGTKITPELLKITRKRYLTLLMRKYNATNGQLPKTDK